MTGVQTCALPILSGRAFFPTGLAGAIDGVLEKLATAAVSYIPCSNRSGTMEKTTRRPDIAAGIERPEYRPPPRSGNAFAAAVFAAIAGLLLLMALFWVVHSTRHMLGSAL